MLRTRLALWLLLKVNSASLSDLDLCTWVGVVSPASKRRQEIVGEAASVTVIDDFAHHPTAIRATLEAIAERYAGRRLIAAFEPRSNSARRAVFQDGFASAFDRTNRVYLAPVYFKENDPIPADERLDIRNLVRAIGARGPLVVEAESTAAMADQIAAETQAGVTSSFACLTVRSTVCLSTPGRSFARSFLVNDPPDQGNARDGFTYARSSAGFRLRFACPIAGPTSSASVS